MHGVPSNLDLTFLHGAELIQVCLSQHQVQVHFSPAGSIFVDGRWELLDGTGERIDQSHDERDRPPYQLHALLNQRVVASEVSPPAWFSLRFERGQLLRVFDDSQQFESFQIQPGGIIV
jgi:hypothetical protein